MKTSAPAQTRHLETWISQLNQELDGQRVSPSKPGQLAVAIVTDSEFKKEEFAASLLPYGVHIVNVNPQEFRNPLDLFENPPDDENLIAVLSEASTLVPDLGNVVRHVSTLDAVWRDMTGHVTHQVYNADVSGTVQTPEGSHTEPVFDWDAQFLPRDSRHSYADLREMGFKRSARDRVLAEFIRDRLFYKERQGPGHENLSLRRTVDVAMPVGEVVSSLVLLEGEWVQRLGILSLCRHAINDGLFFRSPSNRREKNYWFAGLSGVPFTAKSDPIHEATFLTHDIGHQLIPDLLMTADSEDARRLYIVGRMISEAVTMVMADFAYVEALRRQGVDYDFSARKIYPLFSQLGIEVEHSKRFFETLKLAAKANVDFAVKGCDATFRQLLARQNGDTAALDEYRNVYERFFVADYRWAAENAKHVSTNADWVKVWRAETQELRGAVDVTLPTTEELREKVGPGNKNLVDRVFEQFWENNVRPVLCGEPAVIDEGLAHRRVVARYLTGQSAIFYRFAKLAPDLDAKFRQHYLEEAKKAVTTGLQEDFEQAGKTYSQYLLELEQRCLIARDDVIVFNDSFPLFPPSYVSYDSGKGFDSSLREVAEAAVGSETTSSSH